MKEEKLKKKRDGNSRPAQAESPTQSMAPGPTSREDPGKKRKYENISYLGKASTTLYQDAVIGGRSIAAVLDTGATTSAISSRFSQGLTIEKEKAIPVKMGDGTMVYSEGYRSNPENG
jgi:predicted aspartyl protease